MSMTNRRRKMKYIISGSVISLLLVLILPLIPYAISASADNAPKQVVNPIEVPNPGAELWRDVRQRDQPVVGTSQVKGVDSGILISQRGENWRQYRMEKLVPYSAYLLGAVVVARVDRFIRCCSRISLRKMATLKETIPGTSPASRKADPQSGTGNASTARLGQIQVIVPRGTKPFRFYSFTRNEFVGSILIDE